MKLIQHFSDFLTNTVNLNQARIDTLETRVETIKTFLRASGYEPHIRRFSAQGSWAHKTIIKPPNDKKEFDADLVVFIDLVEGWSASDYILELRRVFRENAVYRDKTTMKSRCVTIDYTGDFHLDVVPIVVENGDTVNPTYWVCNRAENVYEVTDGDGFAEWWHAQDAITTSNHLKKATRLLKYLRDSKSTFSAKSVLLTTLMGYQVNTHDRLLNPSPFSDIPTTLRTVMTRLDDWLQARPDLPEVENPVLPGENFIRNWTQEQYENFRSKIHLYRDWIDDAFTEENRDESIRKWRRVFGEDFAKGETVERATTGLALIAESIQRGQDWVAVVISYGRDVLARMPLSLPHVQPVPYRKSSEQVSVRIVAFKKATKDGARQGQINSGDVLRKNSGVEFLAVQRDGLPLPKTYKVFWQVVNTDNEAARANCLRGDYYLSHTHGSRFESTQYRGVHWVQAFVVNKRNDLLVGVSTRFFVVIE